MFSVCDTKDVQYISKKISKIANQVLVTNLSAYKQADIQLLASELQKYSCKIEVIPEQEEAFDIFMRNPKYSNAKLVTGSFYLSGPFKEWYFNKFS